MHYSKYNDLPAAATQVHEGAAGVNVGCHGNTAGVTRHDGPVLAVPFLVPIFWGEFYAKRNASGALTNVGSTTMTDFLKELMVPGSPWLDGLFQYGVRGNDLFEPSNVSEPTFVTTGSDPTGVTQGDVVQALTGWFNNHSVVVSPAPNELNVAYLIFLPPTANMTDQPPGTCGYHGHAKFQKSNGDDNLFFAVIGTKGAIVDGQSGQAFVDAISYCVSHELAEIFTNPDGRGWFAENCEIGDLCECVTPGCTSAVSFSYLGRWQVESYWSEKDHSCWTVPGVPAPGPTPTPDPNAPRSIPPSPKLPPVKSPEFCDESRRRLAILAGNLDVEQSKPGSQQSLVVQKLQRDIAQIEKERKRFCPDEP